MKRVKVLCNSGPTKIKNALRLVYQGGDPNQNVRIALPEFVENVYHLAPSVLDLLEIASFVYAADRMQPRGAKDALEYHAWSRDLDFVVRIRDIMTWSRPEVSESLQKALKWLMGDRSVTFSFSGGHSTPPANLFDTGEFSISPPAEGLAVLPFSGGIDSLTGALWLLKETRQHVCLVSHQSQPKTKRTQNALAAALSARFPGRVTHYKFHCNLVGKRAPEESQRSRSFLYCAIAFAIAHAYNQSVIYVFENGVTSINIGRRQDMLNARSSRTTHPRSLSLIGTFFSALIESPFTIKMPFLWHTKSDVVSELVRLGGIDLLSSSVSCTQTLQNTGIASHCGECFQCIDRRLATHACATNEEDHTGLYNVDITRSSPTSGEAKTTLIDYLRQARTFATLSADAFEMEYADVMADLLDQMGIVGDDCQQVEAVHGLMRRHGAHVQRGLANIRDAHNPFEPLVPGSILHATAVGEHVKPEADRLIEAIAGILKAAIPAMFRKHPPANENDLNAKIAGILTAHQPKLRSEHPLPPFACAGVVVDHEFEGSDVVIETKYIRKGTPPSKATDGLLVDLCEVS